MISKMTLLIPFLLIGSFYASNSSVKNENPLMAAITGGATGASALLLIQIMTS